MNGRDIPCNVFSLADLLITPYTILFDIISFSLLSRAPPLEAITAPLIDWLNGSPQARIGDMVFNRVRRVRGQWVRGNVHCVATPLLGSGFSIQRANSRISHSAGRFRKLENIRSIRLAATKTPFFDLTPSAAGKVTSTNALEILSKVSLTHLITNLDTNSVAAGLDGSSSHTTMPNDISVGLSTSSLSLHTHSGPPLDIPHVNLCHLHVVLIADHIMDLT